MTFENSGKAIIEGDWIVIRVAIPALPAIVEQSPDLSGIKVLDAVSFAHEVVDELNDENERGDTLITVCFDSAIGNAINAGSEWVEEGPVSP